MTTETKSVGLTSIEVEGENFTVLSTKKFDGDRLKRYKEFFDDFKGDEYYQCAIDTDDGKVDHIVMKHGTEYKPYLIECGISFAECSPTQLVEYQFKDGGTWYISKVSKTPLEYYRQSKYAIWKEMLENPTCEAALKRMLETGMITTLFDDKIFITPEEDLKDYIVQDDDGKDVRIPHPVHALRVWDHESKGYKQFSARLDGAPKIEEEEKAWTEILNSIKKKHGSEYITNLTKKKSTEEKGSGEDTKVPDTVSMEE